MKSSWLVWFFIVGVVITILVAFNYQGDEAGVPLSEIFKQSEKAPGDVEYEYVDTQAQPGQENASAPQEIAKVLVQEKAVNAETPMNETASITVESTVKEPAQASIASATPIGKYTIQVASFKDKMLAEKVLAKLKEKDYPAYVVSKNLGEQGTWHRVYVGQFEAKADAQTMLPRVKQEYDSSFIIASK